jgi:dTDP-4-amino-4,6-dideoxygalactose transaminase
VALRTTHGDPVKTKMVGAAPEGADATAASASRPPLPRPRIPFNRPFIAGRELFYISQAVLGGNLAGDGKFTRNCSEWLERTFGARKVLLTHSCTAALEMSAILANVGPGDEVIVPSYTFVSTANAFALRGAELRFVDIREDTLNIDETRIEEAITDRTKVVVPVHYAGVGAEMDVIMEIASRHGLLVIEDAAQAVCATYKDRYLGTIGHLGTYSFHETKNLISGEGGAIVINDEEFIERAEIIRDKGTNRSKFFRGEIDKYTWVDIGSSYLASELVAAFLFAQLEESERIAAKRRATFSYYEAGLHPLQEQGLLRTPLCPNECRHNGHMFYILVESSRTRDALIDHLRDRGIHAIFHYVPLHSSPMGRMVGRFEGDLPVTESISMRMLRLPSYFDLERPDQDRVIDAINSFFNVG